MFAYCCPCPAKSTNGWFHLIYSDCSLRVHITTRNVPPAAAVSLALESTRRHCSLSGYYWPQSGSFLWKVEARGLKACPPERGNPGSLEPAHGLQDQRLAAYTGHQIGDGDQEDQGEHLPRADTGGLPAARVEREDRQRHTPDREGGSDFRHRMQLKHQAADGNQAKQQRRGDGKECAHCAAAPRCQHDRAARSEEHTSELQSCENLVC